VVVRGGQPAGGLPAELSSFVGRRRELAEAKQLTSEYRLVTLYGIGGVGKTRLAVRAAGQMVRAFPDGAWFVDLGEIGQPDQAIAPDTPDRDVLAHLVAAVLGVRPRASVTPVELLCEYLAPRCLLLVLDNCEHVLPVCASVVDTLLRVCPDLRIVATSREPLGLTGEVTYPVLSLPTLDPARRPGLADLTGCESVALFVARAEAALPGFQLTTENCAAVADICHRLDGLPLAIELAAARLRVLTPGEISSRLSDRFALLNSGSRAAPDRQKTLWGCVDWSYELCWKAEQRLWARLSVFSGSFEMDAVEGVCAGDDLDVEDLLDLTAALIDKSVLSRDDHGPVARYRMLETIRVYGRQKLRESGDDVLLPRRHRDWYEQLVERANREWVGDRQAYWVHRLNVEYANLRTALDFCLGEPGEAERALRILVRLPALYWWGRGMFNDGRSWLDRALAQTAEPTAERARAVLLACRTAFAQTDPDAWQRLLAEGEELGRRRDDPVVLSIAAFIRGTVALFADDTTRAVELLERALALLDRAPEPELDHRLHVLFTLVAAAGLVGDEKRAIACYEEVLAVAEPRGEGYHRSMAMWALGLAAWRQGDLPAAAAHEVASLRLKQERGLDDSLGTALCLEVLAWTEAGGQPLRAAVLLGAADAVWSGHGMSIRSYRHLLGHRQECERRARHALGDPGFEQAYRQGRSFTDEESLAYALNEHRRPVAVAKPVVQEPLTRREQQVAALVATGLSNKDIARKLVISQRTAESHVANILIKRGFTSRAQIAAWVAGQATDRRIAESGDTPGASGAAAPSSIDG
jgi:predicted ATPase/DNA-binding CsgD family transcriptional regulator